MHSASDFLFSARMAFDPRITLTLLLGACTLLSGCYSDRSFQITRPDGSVSCGGTEYFVENICEDEARYLEEAAAFPKYKKFSDLNQKVLKQVTHETGDVDRAAALFYQRAISDPRNRAMLEYLSRRETQLERTRPNYSRDDILLAMVPGMFYRDNPEIQADGEGLRKIARTIGLTDTVIPVLQDGTIAENAGIICDYLENKVSARKVILASASKGGGDIKLAIQRCGRQPYFRKVIGWFNIGGITSGNFLLNRLLDSWWYRNNLRFYFWRHDYNWEGLMSTRAGPESPLGITVTIPRHLTVVSVIGVPFSQHVTARARPYYDALVEEGPNDGIVLLAESYVPGGLVFPALRNDHYFRWPLSHKRVVAMLEFMIRKKGQP